MLPAKSQKQEHIYLQYGSGFTAPSGWLNFDSSPTLRLQKIPLVGIYLARWAGTEFPGSVRYGDVIRGLPVAGASCAAVYASHVLEHLSLQDLRTALRNTFRLLRPGGVFRLVVPDLEVYAKRYLESSSTDAASNFMLETGLGHESRPGSLIGYLRLLIGGSKHLWMWDYKGLESELRDAGFTGMRRACFGDSTETRYREVEEESRFVDAVAIESRRPND